MAHVEVRSAEPPKKMGWYAAWQRRPDGAESVRIYHCIPVNTKGDLGCTDGSGTDERYTLISSPIFRGTLWRGPYLTRREAADVIGQA